MKKMLFIFLALSGIAAMMYLLWKKEPQRTEPEGGFCAYESDNYPAKVIEVFPADTAQKTFEVVFEVKRFEETDTLWYSYEFDDYLSEEKLMELKVKPGKTFRYEHKQLTEGSCNPDIYVLHMEAFEEAPESELAY